MRTPARRKEKRPGVPGERERLAPEGYQAPSFRGVMQFDASGPPGATHAPPSYARFRHSGGLRIRHQGSTPTQPAFMPLQTVSSIVLGRARLMALATGTRRRINIRTASAVQESGAVPPKGSLHLPLESPAWPGSGGGLKPQPPVTRLRFRPCLQGLAGIPTGMTVSVLGRLRLTLLTRVPRFGGLGTAGAPRLPGPMPQGRSCARRSPRRWEQQHGHARCEGSASGCADPLAPSLHWCVLRWVDCKHTNLECQAYLPKKCKHATLPPPHHPGGRKKAASVGGWVKKERERSAALQVPSRNRCAWPWAPQ